MSGKTTWLVLVVVLVSAGAQVGGAAAWNVVVPDTVTVENGLVRLADIAAAPVPAQAGKLVVRAGLEPNSVAVVSRQDILRRLVTAGLAHGVRLTGAEQCHLIFPGRELQPAELDREVRAVVQVLVPAAADGAPASWFDLDLPDLEYASTGPWRAETDRKVPLEPGRNLVGIRLVNGDRTESFPAAVILHQYGEVGTARAAITRDRPLADDMFTWHWSDLSELDPGLAVGRTVVQGASASRDIPAGRPLRQADLEETPVVKAGDPVDLQVVRGQVAVTVRAVARQNGCLGQTIPVRNELTGRLVNARVAGPGFVEWRR